MIVSIGVNVARSTEEAEAQYLASRQPAKSAEAAGQAAEEEAPSVEEIFEHPDDVDLEEVDEEEDPAAQQTATEESAEGDGQAEGDGEKEAGEES